MSYFVGSTLVYSKKFVDSAGADADPTSVQFFLRESVDGTELQWTFNAVPVAGTHYPVGMNPIVKDSVGDYHVNFVARKPERHTGMWVGVGSIYDATLTTYFVRHTDLELIDNP